MHIDWWTFALQTVNFLILVWLLQRFLYRPVLTVIGKRREEIQNLVAAADRAKSAAEERRHQLDAALADAARERDRVLTEAREQAGQERESVLNAARGEAEKIVAVGRAQLDAERQAATHQLQSRVVRLAVTLAQRLLAHTGSADPVNPFLDRVIAAIAEMPGDSRAQLARQAAADGVVLASAVALTPDAETGCRSRLGAVLEAAAQLRFAVDPSLIAGIELRLPNLTIGDNWRDHLAGAKDTLSSDG